MGSAFLERLSEGPRIEIQLGDIVDATSEWIVAGVASDLASGGRVHDAVRRRGGDEIARELRDQREWRAGAPMPIAGCVLSSAGHLSARGIIHVVVPTWDGSNDAVAALADAYTNVLRAARARQARSIAIPALGAGRARFPAATVVRVALAAVRASRLDRAVVRFVLSNRSIYADFVWGFAEGV
jgi:O-acetyl-ADP-ribose deacetylase (regulator of RNase III)